MSWMEVKLFMEVFREGEMEGYPVLYGDPHSICKAEPSHFPVTHELDPEILKQL